MKTVAIIGNCQISAIADMLRRTGACEVDEFRLPQFKVDGKVSVNPAVFTKYDHLLSQDAPVLSQDPDFAPLKGEALAAIHPSVIRFPSFLFTGLQPDCSILHAGGRRVETPVGPYSSRIVTAGFVLGIDPQDVVASFNAYTYAKLGFFQEYEKAVAYMRATFATVGFDFDAILADLGSERFMHCINHPGIAALNRLARQIAVRLGLPADIPLADHDALAMNTVWPVYPELARARGIAGGDLSFKPPGQTVPISLERFVEGSYNVYQPLRRDLGADAQIAEVAATLSGFVGKTYA